jgi:hypothetical protein
MQQRARSANITNNGLAYHLQKVHKNYIDFMALICQNIYVRMPQ